MPKKISYPLEKNSIYLCECGEYLFYLINEKKNKESNAENSSDDLSCKQNEQEEAMRNVIFFSFTFHVTATNIGI